MSTCQQCGAQLPVTTNFCTSCGAAAPAPSAGRGPVGKVRSPGTVVLLSIVTLGIYTLFYWWMVTKETDQFTQRPGYAHGKYRLGVFLSLGMFVLLLVGIFAMGGLMAGMDPETGEMSEASMGALGGFFLLMFLAIAVALVASVFLFMAYWRVWNAIRDDETRRGVPSPISPGLMLVFFLVPYVNIVTMWIAIHRTQKGLNGMWEGTQAPVVGGIRPLA